MQLSIELTGDLGVVVVRGEVDTIHAPELEAAARQMLGDGARSLVIDCGGVTFIDSAGLRVMVDAHDRAQAQGGTVTVRHPSPLTLRLLQITALDTLFVIDESPAPDVAQLD